MEGSLSFGICSFGMLKFSTGRNWNVSWMGKKWSSENATDMISLYTSDIRVLGAVTVRRQMKAPFYSIVSSAFLAHISYSELIACSVFL